MPNIIEKVTAFVTRPTSDGYELLLFEHPFAGIQIPAGTVEVHESLDVAVLREASEETGLRAFTISHYIGALDEPSPSGYGLISEQTTVYARPDLSSLDCAYLPKRSALDSVNFMHDPRDSYEDDLVKAVDATSSLANLRLYSRCEQHLRPTA